MTKEQQRAMLDASKAKAQAESGREVQEQSGTAQHPMLRTVPLGMDRDKRLFWKLQTAAVFTGMPQLPPLNCM